MAGSKATWRRPARAPSNNCSACGKPTRARELNGTICADCRREQKAAARAAQPVEYLCKAGNHLARYADMEKTRAGKAGARCYRCRAVQRQTRGQSFVDHAPDRGPAEHLLGLLADHRRAGQSFDEAWEDAVNHVVSRVTGREDGQGWREAFSSTRERWREGWDRTPVHSALTADLIDAEDRVESSQSATLVA